MDKQSIDPLVYRQFEFKPRKGDLRRIRIIEAAIEIFGKQGLAGTTLDSVAKKLKISRSHVVYYFSSKEDLIEAMVRYMIAIAQGIVVDHITSKGEAPNDRLIGAIEAPFVWFEKVPSHVKLTVGLLHGATYDSRLRKINTAFREAGRERMIAAVEAVMKGKMSGAEIRDAGRAIHSMISGLLIDLACSESSRGKEAMKSAVTQSFRMLLD